jgi:hypothetical protein
MDKMNRLLHAGGFSSSPCNAPLFVFVFQSFCLQCRRDCGKTSEDGGEGGGVKT